MALESPKTLRGAPVRNAASWDESPLAGDVFARDAGAWKELKSMLVRVAGAWKWVFREYSGTLYPVADAETSGWTSTPLWQKLDEEGAAYIDSTTFSSPTPSTVDFEVDLLDPVYHPSTAETIVLQFKGWMEEVVGTVDANDATIQLLQGVTVIRTISGPLNTGGYANIQGTLSTAEKLSITDWTDLSVKVSVEASVSNPGDEVVAHGDYITLTITPS